MSAAGTLTHVEVQLAVTDGPTTTDWRGKQFTVDEVVHRAYLYKGGYYRNGTAYGRTAGGEATNVAFYDEHGEDDGDALAALLPAAPEWFEALAAELAAKVGETP